MLTYLRLRASIAFKNFIHEEKGAADIVAVILIVVVAVAAAFLFREQIVKLINNLFEQLNISGLGDKPDMPN
ncbi:MAG: hypothetical protein KHZ15_05370 [Coprobacillus cateniformis]|uniref:Flp1 family type IVb pilin n=1 Tax=Longibaculum muris TaxID=1796628 RepID=UPI003AB30BE3|nr:hypothetical protein [Coprobacillus cateniformis]